jgi:putative ABC transport system permease protein
VFWASERQPDLEDQVRRALAGVDPNFVLYGVDAYNKIVSSDFQQQRLIATLTSLFGVLGLLLAAVGLFGVLAYTVERRTGEIGVRMACGANRCRILGMVLTGALWQVSVGLCIGIPAAIGAGRLMRSQLFGVEPGDPVMLTAAALLLASAALAASLIPAWRASCVEPMAALRTE